MKKLFNGAEAIIYKKNENELIKRRVKKGYRIKNIDLNLRKSRTKKEFKLLRKAKSKGINTPQVNMLKEFEFTMEYLHGFVIRDYINHINKEDLKIIFNKIGKQINSMHENNIIHGDLTTSNMILVKNKVFFIDFSLGCISKKVEDKAVDLHLIKQALISKHNKIAKFCFNIIEENYENKKVINRLKIVEKRGRKK